MLGFSIPRALSSWNMHHGAHLSGRCSGHAVWTSVSATCSLQLTVPLLTDACSMWPKKGITQSLWSTESMYAVKVLLIYNDNVLMYIA